MRELVLTGLPELFPDSDQEKNALYLSEGCFSGNHKDFLKDQDKYEVCPSFWKDGAHLEEAQKYIDELLERVVVSLTNDMNRVYNLEYGKKYWRVIFAFWLLHWLAQLYDRYHQLFHCFRNSREIYSIKAPEEQFQKILSQSHFMQFISTHEYNLELYSDILKNMRVKWGRYYKLQSIELQKLELTQLRINNRNRVNARMLFKQKEDGIAFNKTIRERSRLERITKDLLASFYSFSVIKRNIERVYKTPGFLLKVGLNYIINHRVTIHLLMRFYYLRFWVTGKRKVLLKGVYGVDTLDDFKKLFCDDGKDFLSKIDRISKVQTQAIDDSEFLRDFVPKDNFEFDFEFLVKKLIAKYMPEEFKLYKKIPKYVSNFLFYISSHGDLPLMASIMQNKGLALSSQHGGGYGIIKVFPIACMEYHSLTGFISWGWRHSHVGARRVFPLPSPLLSKAKAKAKKQKKFMNTENTFYFIGTMFLTYYYRFHSDIHPRFYKRYVENKVKFLDTLEARILSRVMYRPHSTYYGIDDVKYVLQKLPVSSIVLDSVEHQQRLLDSRLVIIDHSATTLLQALAVNTPTLLFWNPEQHLFCDEGQVYFDKLRQVKILFDDPVMAARHLNKIGDHVKEWWQQEELQEVREEFCYNYARTSENWHEEWREFIKKMSKAKVNERGEISQW